MFLPPYIALADPDLAVKELELVLADGAPMIQIKSGHAHGGQDNPMGGRSPADPIYDRFWSIVNEAEIRLAVHLGGTDYQKYGADWSEDPDTVFGDFDAFQWMMYWGDRPALELTAGLILHNFFGRFPNIKVCLSEMGTVWLPYTMRKMDHAFLMGRKAKWSETGRLDRRPSEIFRQHFIVAPYPEENVRRVVDEIGIEPIVFGSDFPHGEGLAYPHLYVGLAAEQVLRGRAARDHARQPRDIPRAGYPLGATGKRLSPSAPADRERRRISSPSRTSRGSGHRTGGIGALLASAHPRLDPMRHCGSAAQSRLLRCCGAESSTGPDRPVEARAGKGSVYRGELAWRLEMTRSGGIA